MQDYKLTKEEINTLESLGSDMTYSYYNNNSSNCRFGEVTHNGRVYLGFDTFMNDVVKISRTQPQYIRHATALAMTMDSNDNVRPDYRHGGTNTQSAAVRVKALMEDALGYYDLMRITPKQKDYIYNWMMHAIETHGRTPHERAVIMLHIFSGQSTSMRRIYQKGTSGEPYQPALGAFGKTQKILGYLIRVLQKLGAFEGHDSDVLAASVMEDAGCDATEYRMAHRMRATVNYYAHLAQLAEFLDSLGDAVPARIPNPVNMEILIEGILAGLPSNSLGQRPSYSSLNYRLERINATAASLRTSGISTAEDTDMEAFVDEMAKRWVTRIKQRG